MFDSLVESGSHKDDLARKGSFLLGTLVVYAVLGVAIVIGSIYWYNSSIPDPSLELLTLVAPVPVQQEQAKPQQKDEPKPAASKEPQVSMRQEISVVAPVVQSHEVAKETTREVARNVSSNIVVGNRDIDAPPTAGPPGPAVGLGGTGGSGNAVGPVAKVEDDAPPPPPAPPKPTPTPEPKKTIVSGGVLNGKAISKPAPAYPPIAKAARAQGSVTVQITVDEQGRVISAVPVSGHPLLQQAAAAAVRGWRFSPTLLSGQPVKVTGTVTVNFTLQ